MHHSFQKYLKLERKKDSTKKIQTIKKLKNSHFNYKINPFKRDDIFLKIQQYLLKTHSILIQNLRHQCIERDLTQQQQCVLITLKEDQSLYNLFSGILAIQACVRQIIKQNNGIFISFIKATNLLFINFKLMWQQLQSYKRVIKTSQSLNTSIKVQNQESGMLKFFDSLKFLGIIIKSSWGELQQISQKDKDQSIIYEHMKQQIQKLQSLMSANYENMQNKLIQLQNSQQQVIISELQRQNNFLKWRLSEKENTITQYQQSIYNLDLSQYQSHLQKDQFNLQSQIILNQENYKNSKLKQIDSNFTFNDDFVNQKILVLSQEIYLLKNNIQDLTLQNKKLKQEICNHSELNNNQSIKQYDNLLQQINLMKTSLNKLKQDNQMQLEKIKQKEIIIQTMNAQFITQMKKYNTVFFKLNTQIQNLQKIAQGKDKVINQLTKINKNLQFEVHQNKQVIQEIQSKILKIPNMSANSAQNKQPSQKKSNNLNQVESYKVNEQSNTHTLFKENKKKDIKEISPIKPRQISPLKKIDVQISGGKMSISQRKISNENQNQKNKTQYDENNLQEYLKHRYEKSEELKILRQKSKKKQRMKSSSPSKLKKENKIKEIE